MSRRITLRVPTTRRPIRVQLVPAVLDRAGQLDREADVQLAAGRHAEAERLSIRAAELRGWA